MVNLGDTSGLVRGVISELWKPGERPALEQGFPALLDLYRRFEISITHFIEGWSAEAYSDCIEKILADDHQLGMQGCAGSPTILAGLSKALNSLVILVLN